MCYSSDAQSLQNKKTFNIGPQLKTNGFGLLSSIDLGTIHSTPTSLDIGISTLKHVKEVKVRSLVLPNPYPYVYGKANRAFEINTSLSVYHTLGHSKLHKPSIRIGASLGPSFAITRPVYVYVIDYDANENSKQSLQRYNEQVHQDQSSIQGDAGWSYGFSELKAYAGIHLSLFTQIGQQRDFSQRRICTGVNVDIYPSDLKLMIANNNQVFTSLFISYQIGTNPF
jgi:hypothetical protein